MDPNNYSGAARRPYDGGSAQAGSFEGHPLQTQEENLTLNPEVTTEINSLFTTFDMDTPVGGGPGTSTGNAGGGGANGQRYADKANYSFSRSAPLLDDIQFGAPGAGSYQDGAGHSYYSDQQTPRAASFRWQNSTSQVMTTSNAELTVSVKQKVRSMNTSAVVPVMSIFTNEGQAVTPHSSDKSPLYAQAYPASSVGESSTGSPYGTNASAAATAAAAAGGMNQFGANAATNNPYYSQTVAQQQLPPPPQQLPPPQQQQQQHQQQYAYLGMNQQQNSVRGGMVPQGQAIPMYSENTNNSNNAGGAPLGPAGNVMMPGISGGYLQPGAPQQQQQAQAMYGGGPYAPSMAPPPPPPQQQQQGMYMQPYPGQSPYVPQGMAPLPPQPYSNAGPYPQQPWQKQHPQTGQLRRGGGGGGNSNPYMGAAGDKAGSAGARHADPAARGGALPPAASPAVAPTQGRGGRGGRGNDASGGGRGRGSANPRNTNSGEGPRKSPAPPAATAAATPPPAIPRPTGEIVTFAIVKGKMEGHRYATHLRDLQVGDAVLTEGDRGCDLGTVTGFVDIPTMIADSLELWRLRDEAAARGAAAAATTTSSSASAAPAPDSAPEWDAASGDVREGLRRVVLGYRDWPWVLRRATAEEVAAGDALRAEEQRALESSRGVITHFVETALQHKMEKAAAASEGDGAAADEESKMPSYTADDIQLVACEFQLHMEKLTLYVSRPSMEVFIDFRRMQRKLHRSFQCRIWMAYVDETGEDVDSPAHQRRVLEAKLMHGTHAAKESKKAGDKEVSK